MRVAGTGGTPEAPESSAVRVALWRALHVELDAPPPVLADTLGLELAAPEKGWRNRGDMHPTGTRGFRASIVGRARFIEDLVATCVEAGVEQYVILGAGLDTFAQRSPSLASRLRIFEVDEPGPQAWKRHRLGELGYGPPPWLVFVPADFASGIDWWNALVGAGFDPARPAVVASSGVSMYLEKSATVASFARLAQLAPGSTLAMTFLLPAELVDPADRPGLEMSERGAAASGTPFVSFYTPTEIVGLATDAGFAEAHHVAGREIGERYFAGRSDGLFPSSGEDFLVAMTSRAELTPAGDRRR